MSMVVKIPERIVPLEKKLKEGTTVMWGEQPIYEKNEAELVVEVANELKISPRDIFKHLRVSLGETVEKDTVIAERKTMLSKISLVAPQHGEVRAIDHDAGTVTLIIREASQAHFTFQGTYTKSDKQELIFSVPEGTEYEVLTSITKTFGAKTAYIHAADEITLEHCDGKVIVTSLHDTMAISKIAALGPVAVVTGNPQYSGVDSVVIVIKHKSDWQDLIKHKWSHSLYIEGSKSVYFYRT